MSAIASPEFVSLCHAQLRLLTQQMAESTAALYIADIAESKGGKASNFVPVVSYPEPVDSWIEKFSRTPSQTPWEPSVAQAPLTLPGTVSASLSTPADDRWPTLSPEPIEPTEENSASDRADRASARRPKASAAQPNESFESADRQLVVPLVYTDVVVGLLVAIRRDRPWESQERSYVETMADSLAAGCVLERRNQWLQSRIAHRRGLQSRQSEIFHNLLHQFRNPLTAVNTFGKLLVRRLEPEDPNQTVATGIVRETSRLRELVTHFDEAVAVGDANLIAEAAPTPLLSSGLPLLPQGADGLAGSRSDGEANGSESGGSELAHHSLGHAIALSHQSMAEIVDPILAVAGIVAAEKGVVLHAQVSRNTPVVWGEEEALSEVVSNLVDNAVKYSPVGAEVWVQTGVSRMDEMGHYQGIVVADTGPGIPAEDLERLFERYYRGVQAAGALPGTGLGLAIARALVEEMYGAIEVVSPAVGTPWLPSERVGDVGVAGPGTVFIVWLLEVS